MSWPSWEFWHWKQLGLLQQSIFHAATLAPPSGCPDHCSGCCQHLTVWLLAARHQSAKTLRNKSECQRQQEHFKKTEFLFSCTAWQISFVSLMPCLSKLVFSQNALLWVTFLLTTFSQAYFWCVFPHSKNTAVQKSPNSIQKESGISPKVLKSIC